MHGDGIYQHLYNFTTLRQMNDRLNDDADDDAVVHEKLSVLNYLATLIVFDIDRHLPLPAPFRLSVS